VFENDASALIGTMISGQHIVLTPRQQCLVAGWLTKFVVLGRLATSHDNEAECELPRTLLLDMMGHGLPPGGTSVRIAQRDPSWVADAEPTSEVSHLLPEPLTPPLYVGVTALGCFAFEVVVGDVGDMLKFIAQTDDDDWFIRVWPPGSEEKCWPPDGVLTQVDILSLIVTWEASIPPEDLQPGRRFEWTPRDSR
jgi:hypothetical protein